MPRRPFRRTIATVVFFILTLPIVAPAAADAPNCSTVIYSGSGTSGDPYQVGTVDQLQCIEDQGLDAHYILTGDIDASETSVWNSGDGFDPIGGSLNRFTGTFDGNGYTITGLTIDRANTNSVGLFGYVDSGGTVANVSLEGVNVTGKLYVGGLSGDVRGTVSSSYATGDVSGDDDVGGLVGRSSGTVEDSYATGTVGGVQNVGGLLGSNSGTVSNSYAAGDVSGNSRVGGLAGNNEETISRSYATGSVDGSSDVGGLVGTHGGTVSDSYWDKGTTNQASAIGGGGGTSTGLTGFGSTGDTTPAPEMQGVSASTNMSALDFANTWEVVKAGGRATADGYPILSRLDRAAQLQAQGITDPPPAVSAITRGSPATQETSAASVDFEVSFSEPVIGVDGSDFTVTQVSGNASGTIALLSGTGSSYTVTVNGISGNGVLRLDLEDDDSITDDAGKSLGGTGMSGSTDGSYTSGETYTIDPVKTIYVDADASSGGDGSSWTDAYTSLQDALGEATDNDEIWIAEGTYTPDPGGIDESASFTITGDQDGLEIYGGFESGDAFADRNPGGHPVVLSGDIGGDDDPFAPETDSDSDASTFSGTDHINGANSDHVLVFDGGNGIGADVAANVTDATVLDGVTVTGGQADGSSSRDVGGGLYCDGSGDATHECSPTLRNAVFAGNRASNRGGAVYNAGFNDGASSPVITNAVFTSNRARIGGAVVNAGTFGGESSPQITNVVFTGNRASGNRGGAILNDGLSGASSPQITNVTFTDNSAGQSGGAIYNDGSSGGASSPAITNTIFYDNTADSDGNGSGSGDEVYNLGSGAMPALSHTLIQGGAGGVSESSGSSTSYLDESGNPAGSFAASTNLAGNPQFAAATDPNGADDIFATDDDGLRLTEGSPALDAGDNDALPPDASDLDGDTSEPIPFDLTGAERIVDNDDDAATPAVVDLGAYEASSSTQLPVELASFEGATTENGVQLSWQTASKTGNAGFRIQRKTGQAGGPGEKSRQSGSSEEESSTVHGGASPQEWHTVGRVEGGGTTSQPQSYRFTDADLPYAADSVAYRLKQVDTDGSVSFSAPITVARSGPRQVELLGTYPNPTRQRARIRYALPAETSRGETVRLRLYDVMGRQVRAVEADATAGRHERTLDVSDLAAGVYILRLQAGGADETRKLTVVR